MQSGKDLITMQICKEIDKVEYWNFLRLPFVLIEHNIDVGKPYGKKYAPTGEMWNFMCGFGNHLIVMYNKGMGNKQVLRVD